MYTSLTQNKELQPLQKEVLKLIEKNIGKMNDVQKAAFEKKAAKEETKPKEKRKKIKGKNKIYWKIYGLFWVVIIIVTFLIGVLGK